MALEVSGLDRADLYLDDRPRASVDLAGPTATVNLENAAGAGAIRVEGFSDGELVAARTMVL